MPTVSILSQINPLNAKLNPICHLLALLGVHHILHVSRIGVNYTHTFPISLRSVSPLYLGVSVPTTTMYSLLLAAMRSTCAAQPPYLDTVSMNVRI
jgi:hypothetical protein